MRHRLGPNYVQLLVNAPKYAHHNHHHVVKVNYFTSRYDPVRHAERYPIPPAICSGRRERCIIEKENSFEQLGREIPFFHAPDRYSKYSFTPQTERFICRWIVALSDPRITHEIRCIWSQADQLLGQKLGSRLNVRPSI
ncbi:PREDICTED: catalase-2-like isoform X7 [Tarenaya hassleriana]|uniref:catalase-2-like isoform X7 n=1 Tax=Tarenaya hassleriana TaxID=28532 RepID=UPI0008FD2ADE|nr:PREDICTED: catalase-2-like isoform X7 [Tarenaya hassleriana]